MLWSYVINMRPRPDMGTEPYAIAVVKLAEGPQMMTNIVGCPQTPEALQLDMPLKVTFAKQTTTSRLPLFEPAQEADARMKQKSVAVVGAAETTKMGKIPDVSVIGLHADAALNALADCGLKPSDIDGVATAGISPVELAHYLGITPTYADGTSVGGCSFMLHVRHAAAAINEGLCNDRPDHPRRKRPLAASAPAASAARPPAWPASSKCPTARWARRPCSPSRCCAT